MTMGDTTGASGGEAERTSAPQQTCELSHILSTISHEIKNPLASLKLNAQLISRAIEQGKLPRSESARLLMQAVDQLNAIASELSDAARADSDRVALALKPVDIVALARRCATDAEATYRRPIRLEAPSIPLLAQADEARIRATIDALLANAVAYTPADRAITLAVRQAGARVRVEARDEGPGIAQQDLPYIFHAFYRGASVPQPGAPEGIGLGLGLYIVRGIIRRHGGEVGAESAPGQGATVWFTLPQVVRN